MEANGHLKLDVENGEKKGFSHSESMVKGALPDAERLQIVYRDLQYTVKSTNRLGSRTP